MTREPEKKLKEPWTQPWPADDLELVKQCPVCGERQREILYSTLVDKLFRVARGKWTLWACENCGSAYLDPRPSPASIGRAYGTYYTHETNISEQISADQLGFMRKIRRAISNGYLNARFGTHRLPAYKWGYFLAQLFPQQRKVLDSEFRFLPKPGAGQSLLDIGCANGAFIIKALSAGWKAVGVDLDPKAIAKAENLDLNVKVGSVELFSGESNCYEAITISHVIEHVHKPAALLNDIYRLLSPGGFLYVETPNIESLGSKIYRENWHAIDSPRHLVIFNHKSLNSILRKSGYDAIKNINRNYVMEEIIRQSHNLKNPNSQLHKNSVTLKIIVCLSRYLSIFLPKKSEYVTVIARKPL